MVSAAPTLGFVFRMFCQISCLVSTLFDVCHCRSSSALEFFGQTALVVNVFAIRKSFGRKETIYDHVHVF